MPRSRVYQRRRAPRRRYAPTAEPSFEPTLAPSYGPTPAPTPEPSPGPSHGPTYDPTYAPTTEPSFAPTKEPTYEPTYVPSSKPTATPIIEPTAVPTYSPTSEPSFAPSDEPTYSPSYGPTPAPSPSPIAEPTPGPTRSPSLEPSYAPSAAETPEPTPKPSEAPTQMPTFVVASFTCDPNTATPVQVLRYEDADDYSVRDLNLLTGEYEKMYDIDYFDGHVNAVALYAHANGLYYALGSFAGELCWFDAAGTSCVGSLEYDSPNAGAVVRDVYYYAKSPGKDDSNNKIYFVEDVAGTPRFETTAELAISPDARRPRRDVGSPVRGSGLGLSGSRPQRRRDQASDARAQRAAAIRPRTLAPNAPPRSGLGLSALRRSSKEKF